MNVFIYRTHILCFTVYFLYLTIMKGADLGQWHLGCYSNCQRHFSSMYESYFCLHHLLSDTLDLWLHTLPLPKKLVYRVTKSCKWFYDEQTLEYHYTNPTSSSPKCWWQKTPIVEWTEYICNFLVIEEPNQIISLQFKALTFHRRSNKQKMAN